MNHFDKIDVRVFDKFIEKFAARYIKQRSELSSAISDKTLTQAKSLGCDFDMNNLLNVIKQNSIAKDFNRESGKQPNALRDIYRSDLGELLTTYYFKILPLLAQKVPLVYFILVVNYLSEHYS